MLVFLSMKYAFTWCGHQRHFTCVYCLRKIIKDDVERNHFVVVLWFLRVFPKTNYSLSPTILGSRLIPPSSSCVNRLGKSLTTLAVSSGDQNPYTVKMLLYFLYENKITKRWIKEVCGNSPTFPVSIGWVVATIHQVTSILPWSFSCSLTNT